MHIILSKMKYKNTNVKNLRNYSFIAPQHAKRSIVTNSTTLAMFEDEMVIA